MARSDTDRAARTATELSPAWRVALPSWALLAGAILIVFWKDTAGLVSVWLNSATFQHALLIPPIIAYLVWIRRREVLALTPKPFLPAGVLLFGFSAGWLLGDLAGVALVRHTALVGMLMSTVPLVLGLTVTRGLTFPLFYAIFMIPFGDQLIPSLQMITAKMCIVLLDWFDVPAYIDGVFIEIPTGSFEVAEACSGVRFLIAMVAFSTLVAHLCFKSAARRIACVVAAVVLAIVANGLRAWGTIYIAWLTDPSFAQGVDHVIYGWFFFAIIMAVVLGVGWFFFDRPVDDPAFDPDRLQPAHRRIAAAPRRYWVGALAGIAAAAAMPAYAALTAERAGVEVAALRAPDVPGWQKVPTEGSGWTPLYENADASVFQSYEDRSGRRVDLFIAVYGRQTEEQEMVSYGNGLMAPEGDWSWARSIDAPASMRGVQLQRRPYTRDAWQTYLIGGSLVASDYQAKLEMLKARLLAGEMLAGTLVLSVERVGTRGEGPQVLAEFAEDLGSPETAIREAVVPD